MKVYTLVGKSGTGKSYHALDICNEYNIDTIIDDGLLIHKNRVVAGISAKRQSTMVGAIKTAVFTNDEHRDVVVSTLCRINPKKILILGTSDRMMEKIIGRLSLPHIYKTIRIEDITTEEERETANKQRHIFGKHVIPVPSPQLKRDFAGYFVDPLQVIRDLGLVKEKYPASHKNKTRNISVVRPTFSYMGDFIISSRVINDIVGCVAVETAGVRKIARMYSNMEIDAMVIDIKILVEKYSPIWDVALALQKAVNIQVENMTAFNVATVNVEVVGVV